eukprot:CAMPEP_0172761264 /NCGR_PEP_ID=MMETSP1074-20121228/171255_1 /TAXON_ID=2916 /ORGANISM="Ceratium fusus, Strain PA161109" /LENGTH=122 /DNA_ID=CAMNT_0013595431 /DNA_START=169 /DNA_END=537 /DNA_ORIENTATION=+
MDDLELNLPPSVKNNPWLKQKFMRRMEHLKQKSIAELQQPMHLPVVMKLHDRKEPPNGLFEPMNVVVGSRDCAEHGFVIGIDKVHAPVQIPQGESDELAATMVRIPSAKDISMPMKLLSTGL